MSRTIDIEGRSPGSGGRRPRRRRTGTLERGQMIALAVTGAVFLTFGLILFLGVTGRLGVTQIEANQVGVRVNYLTGEETVVTQPGYQFYLPLLQRVFTFDRTTQEYVMSGQDYAGTNRAPRLTVRANDGSNFWFEELKIQYEIIPGAADVVLNDSGQGDLFKQEWIKAHARSILRDEFGRYSAVEVADPTVYKQAPEEARRRINEILEPHGINVVRIITPNPKFDPAYEDAIETRKEADQEVQELQARVQQLEQVREQRLAAVRKEKEVEMQDLTGDLTRELLTAERDAIRITKEADAYSARRVAEGQAEKAQLTAQAEGLVAKYKNEAEGIASRAQALEERGQVVVREALVKKLLGIHFRLMPYSRDPAPRRLEYSGDRNDAPPPPELLSGLPKGEGQ